MLLSFAVNDNKSVWHCRLFVGKKDEAELMKTCKSSFPCLLHFYNLLCERAGEPALRAGKLVFGCCTQHTIKQQRLVEIGLETTKYSQSYGENGMPHVYL